MIIPQNTSEGNFIIKASVFFNGEENSVSKDMFLEKCKEVETNIEEIKEINLGEKKMESEVKKPANLPLIISLIASMIVVIIATIYLLYVIMKKSY